MNQSSAPTITDTPSQVVLDALAETLAALVAEAQEITGDCNATASIHLCNTPPEVWHQFPQTVTCSSDKPGQGSVWKQIARSRRATITSFCGHPAGDCPDNPRAVES